MKKAVEIRKTLKLDRETIRILSKGDMGNVQGGQRHYPTHCCDGMTADCN